MSDFSETDERALIARVNTMPAADAHAAFFRCCGVERWAVAMTDTRPYADFTALDARADALWRDFTAADWRAAFSHHPKIGDIRSLRARFTDTRAATDWEGGEQAGATTASEETLQALANGNDAYLGRFGYIFIVCATGKTADEMLALLQARLPNEPDDELAIAAGEQKKITRLRLRKL